MPGSFLKKFLGPSVALCCVALLSLLLAGCAESPAPEVDIFPYAHQIDDLPNGLRLITVTTGYPNIVALYTVVQVGSRNEIEPGRSGFAHLFEHLMFRGTEKFPAEKWGEIMQGAGASTKRLHQRRPDGLPRPFLQRGFGADSGTGSRPLPECEIFRRRFQDRNARRAGRIQQELRESHAQARRGHAQRRV